MKEQIPLEQTRHEQSPELKGSRQGRGRKEVRSQTEVELTVPPPFRPTCRGGMLSWLSRRAEEGKETLSLVGVTKGASLSEGQYLVKHFPFISTSPDHALLLIGGGLLIWDMNKCWLV